MLLRIFTHSLKSSISDEAVCICGWLVCPVTELRSATYFIQIIKNTHPARSKGGERTASMHFEKVRGNKVSSNRRTGYWYAVPSRANLRKHMWCGSIWMWKYASFKSMDATSPWGESAPGSVQAKSSRTDACRALCWWAWDVVLGRVLHLSWAAQNNHWKNCTPACLLGVVLLLLSQEILWGVTSVKFLE